MAGSSGDFLQSFILSSYIVDMFWISPISVHTIQSQKLEAGWPILHVLGGIPPIRLVSNLVKGMYVGAKVAGVVVPCRKSGVTHTHRVVPQRKRGIHACQLQRRDDLIDPLLNSGLLSAHYPFFSPCQLSQRARIGLSHSYTSLVVDLSQSPHSFFSLYTLEVPCACSFHTELFTGIGLAYATRRFIHSNRLPFSFPFVVFTNTDYKY